MSKISEYLQIARRYTRSIRIERDYKDTNILEGYVVTPAVQYALQQMIAGLQVNSSQRAWRITGPYGAGKSAFGVFLANLISRSNAGYEAASSILKKVSEETAEAIETIPRYLPVPLTGSRARFGDVLLSGLIQALEFERIGGRNPAVLARIKDYRENAADGHVEDSRAIELISDFAQYVRRSALPYDGILIMIDEMGKFLEYAAIRPDNTDAFLFQRLAELASGSSEIPVAVIGFLHHQFAEYAIGYGQRAEEEWAKVAERFEEIPFDESPEQYAFLLASAIQSDTPVLKEFGVADRAQELYHTAVSTGISATSKRHEDLINAAVSLYPIHPVTLIALASGIKRFGQNERSLFSFLLSHEPFAFQQFINANPVSPDVWYRLPDLYDYMSSIATLRFRDGDRRRRWDFLRNTLLMTQGLSELEQGILKVVGLINVLEPLQGLKADRKTITFALRDTIESDEISRILLLLTQNGLLYQRSAQMDYCLWSNTSVDLQAIYEEAERRVPPIASLETFLADLPKARPLIAHRHYHRTGTLRAFGIVYSSLSKMQHQIVGPDLGGFDGLIIVVPIGFNEDFSAAKTSACLSSATQDARVLVHLIEVTHGDLATARELRLWQWIESNCQELRVDEFARTEVKKRLEELSSDLEYRLASFLAFEDPVVERQGAWIHKSHELRIPDRKCLNQKLSSICDEVYYASPVVKSELINRSKLSTAVASARMRLVGRMLEKEREMDLGLTGTPPERAIYLSIFHASGLHREESGTRRFYHPTEDDPCNWRRVWYDTRQLLATSGRISGADYFRTLEQPPYGMRESLSSLLLVAFVQCYRNDVSLFERGSYVVQLTAEHFARLFKSPHNFTLHYVPTESSKATLIGEYWQTVKRLTGRSNRETDPAEVVRELYRWATSLSDFTMQTQSISKIAKNVRLALQKSSDPMDLLYDALPRACNAKGLFRDGELCDAEMKNFLQQFDNALDELALADRGLRREVESSISEAFQMGGSIAKMRVKIRETCVPFANVLDNYKLKSFLAKAADTTLSDDKWIDSVATLLAGRILPHWQDDTLNVFRSEARVLAGQLKRWVALMLGHLKSTPSVEDLASVTVTGSDGNEYALAVLKKVELPAKLEDLKEQVKSIILRDIDTAPIVLAQILAEIVNIQGAEEAKHGATD